MNRTMDLNRVTEFTKVQVKNHHDTIKINHTIVKFPTFTN